jgi:hypothetical protein
MELSAVDTNQDRENLDSFENQILVQNINKYSWYLYSFEANLYTSIVYSRGSQPVVRVPLVVRQQVLGGTQKHSKSKLTH